MKLACSRNMRRRFGLYLLALLAVGGMVYTALQPPTLREVVRWPNTADARLTPQGVLRVSKRGATALQFSQYDFTGRARWAVRVEMGYATTKLLSSAWPFYDVSPDGRVLAVATVREKKLVIQTWRDGVALGKAVAPQPANHPAKCVVTLAVQDSGQVWVLPVMPSRITAKPQPFTVYLIDGATLLPGTYQVKTPKPPDGFYRASLAPDGALLLVEVYDNSPPSLTMETVALRLDKRRVRGEFRHTRKVVITAGDPRNWLFVGGRSIADDGAVYDLDGQVRAATPGWKIPFQWWLRTPDQRVILQVGSKGQRRLFDVPSGKSWPLRVDGELAPSVDGRFVAALMPAPAPHPLAATLRGWSYRLPVVGPRLQWRDTRWGKATLSVHEGSGLLRARRTCRIDTMYSTSYQRAKSLAISPDGRYVLLADTGEPERGTQEYVLYRR